MRSPCSILGHFDTCTHCFGGLARGLTRGSRTVKMHIGPYLQSDNTPTHSKLVLTNSAHITLHLKSVFYFALMWPCCGAAFQCFLTHAREHPAHLEALSMTHEDTQHLYSLQPHQPLSVTALKCHMPRAVPAWCTHPQTGIWASFRPEQVAVPVCVCLCLWCWVG